MRISRQVRPSVRGPGHTVLLADPTGPCLSQRTIHAPSPALGKDHAQDIIDTDSKLYMNCSASRTPNKGSLPGPMLLCCRTHSSPGGPSSVYTLVVAPCMWRGKSVHIKESTNRKQGNKIRADGQDGTVQGICIVASVAVALCCGRPAECPAHVPFPAR
jgi:hypothetical protein